MKYFSEFLYEANKSGDSSLRDWFTKSRASDGTPGWVQLGGKYAGKPCAKQPGQTTKPKCGSSKMKANLSDEEEEKAFRRKNRQDPNPDRRGKAKNVATEEVKKDHEFSMARSQLKTLKNAASRLQKKMGKKGEGELKAWVQSKITKATDYIDTAADYVTNEETVQEGKKDACYHKVKARYDVWPSAYASGALVKCRKKGAKNWGNKSEGVNFTNWRDNYKPLEIETTNIIEPEPLQPSKPVIDEAGTQKLFGKTYNRCVKEENITFVEFRGLCEGAAWTKKAGKNKEGGLNEKGRKSYERENPGSDLKAPSKKKGNKRRASFCARMKGMKKKLTSAKTANDPDSRINKSLRAWNC